MLETQTECWSERIILTLNSSCPWPAVVRDVAEPDADQSLTERRASSAPVSQQINIHAVIIHSALCHPS